ncbi:hypothetical protein BUE80_DR011274 [Diplocarpon rosae]|nr:hypothetical protein BUE80_DR011274 [Diplocarpon rosae]
MSYPTSGGASATPGTSTSRFRTRISTRGKAKRRKSRARRDDRLIPDPVHKPNTASPFLRLPNELKHLVVNNLPVRDVPNLRLISEAWAAAGAKALFRDGLEIRPYLDDMARLKGLSDHEEIAKGVKSLVIYAGDMRQDQLEAGVTREEEYLKRITGGQLSAKIWKYIDALYNPIRFSSYCNPATLGECLPRLPNLETLRITSFDCPVPCIDNNHSAFASVWESMEESYAQTDDELSHFLSNRASIQRYGAILASALRCMSIRKITMDAFPVDMFRPQRLQDEYGENAFFSTVASELSALTPGPRLKKSLAHIKELKIAILGAGRLRHYDASMGRNMAEFIGCFQNLTSLDLSYEEQDDENDECCIGFEESFFRLRFPHLTSLRFSGTDSQPSDMGRFLVKHRATLRYLFIGECAVSFQDTVHREVLTNLRDHMKLTKFELFAEHGPRLYDENWNPVVVRDGQIHDAKLIELFVIGRCPWPMLTDGPSARTGEWKRKFMGSHMELLELGEEELKDLLGEDWETEGEEEDEEMGDGESIEDYYDSLAEEFLGFSDHDGYGEENNESQGNGEWEEIMDVD